jgi:hypothetical protein
MWVVIMLVVAVLAGAGVYWLSLATLPEDEDLPASGVRPGSGRDVLRRAASWLRRAVARVRADVGGLHLADRLRTGLQHLGLAGGDVEAPPSGPDPAGDGGMPARPRSAAVAAPASAAVAARSAPSEGGAVAKGAVAKGAVAASPAAAPPNPAPAASQSAPLRERVESSGPSSAWPAAPSGEERSSSSAARARAAQDVAPEDVLYVPVVRDQPTAHTRLVGFLGILALVTTAGGLLALAVWQTVHLIARAVQHVSGS